MESRDHAGSGYPEEGPPGADPGEEPGGDAKVSQESERRAQEESGGEGARDDGKATGNPKN
jgi:hypothetical protein